MNGKSIVIIAIIIIAIIAIAIFNCVDDGDDDGDVLSPAVDHLIQLLSLLKILCGNGEILNMKG